MANSKKLSTQEILVLMAVVQASTTEDNGVLYVKEEDTLALVEAGFVEVNITLTDENGGVATRATEEGKLYTVYTADEEPKASSRSIFKEQPFELETGIALPTVRRGSRGSHLYPFEQMKVGHSFHVPAVEDRQNPAKTLASTVSTATSRYKDEAGNVTRKFVIRKVGSEDPKGEGARIFRVQ